MPEADFSGAHAAKESGRVGPPLLGLVALLPSDEKPAVQFPFYYLGPCSSWNIKNKKKEVFCLPEIKYKK